jgi:hypothetical protein
MSKHVRNFESFRNHKNDNHINEEILGLGNLFAAAKGAFKNFLTGLQAPFKNLSADFKKGLERGELKKKISAMLDTLLKTTNDSINKAEDESALNNIMDQFRKSFDEQCAEVDKEIKTVKESKLILEASVKGGLIAGRVLLGLVKQKAAEIKMEYDKKFAAAKDLAAKKAARIAEVKAIVDDFKKKVTDDKYIDEQIKKYKDENKIEGGDEPAGGTIILDWGDVEIEVSELKADDATKHPGYFQIVKSGSKKLIVKEGETVLAKIAGEVKKGDKVKLTDILRNEKPDPLKEYETGSLEKIVVDGKEVENHTFGVAKAEGQEDLVKTLGDVKTKNPEAIKKISDIAKLYQDPTTNKDKIAEIEKQLGGGE